MADTPTNPAPDTAPQFTTVTLSTPIRRGETLISELTLRKPKGGELRGLSLQDLLRSDITAILQVTQRVSNPPLIRHEVDDLGPEDIAEIGGAIRGFFMSASERKLMETVLEEYAPKS